MCVSINKHVMTLTVDLLNLKLVAYASRIKGAEPSFQIGTLGLWVLELFAMYATDGRTD